jgi:CubicO group peptidase (beta-lactamase class C family)
MVRDALTHCRTSRGSLDVSRSRATKGGGAPAYLFVRSLHLIISIAQWEAAKAAGTTWEDASQRIFTPLGMTSSGVVRQPDRWPTRRRRISSGDTVQSGAHGQDCPAGSILSSARHGAMAPVPTRRWTFGGKRLVSAAALRETHTPQMLMGAAGDSITRFNTYGMGWMVQDYRGRLMWQHGGNTDGMTTAMGVLPDQKFGVAVLSNQHGSPLPDLLMRYLFDRALGVPMRDLSAEALARWRRSGGVPTPRSGRGLATRGQAPPPLPLSAYEGTYADSLYGEAKISLKDGKL